MRRHGETPTGGGQHRLDDQSGSISLGDRPRDGGDTAAGPDRESGGRIEPFGFEHAPSGTGRSMWRCAICGAIGTAHGGIPETCENCETVAATVMWWTRDEGV